MELTELVAQALTEDVGGGDMTSESIVGAGERGRARIVQKGDGVVFGLAAAEEAFRQAGAESFEALGQEGEWREAPADVAAVAGPARAILAGERVALNLLGRLSGVATLTARFVRAVDGTGARILDTRKTTPGLRELEKQAVCAGGGHNHRMGLYDDILIKENHVAVAGGVGEAIRRARDAHPEREIEVECRTLDDLREALAAGAQGVLLDNMSPDELREAVAVAEEASGERARDSIEASGGVTLENVRDIAETGVDYISVGVLTHSAPALDLSLLLEATG